MKKTLLFVLLAAAAFSAEGYKILNKIKVGGKRPGVYPISARNGQLVSNRVPFAVDTLPEALDKEPNSRQENAQRVRLPVNVNGRIDRPGDWDVFRFDGRAGEEIVAEVSARRRRPHARRARRPAHGRHPPPGTQSSAGGHYHSRGANRARWRGDSFCAPTPRAANPGRRVPLGTLPAIPFEIVQNVVAHR